MFGRETYTRDRHININININMAFALYTAQASHRHHKLLSTVTRFAQKHIAFALQIAIPNFALLRNRYPQKH